MTWIQEHVHFELLDYVHEVEHVADRIVRLEKTIADAVQKAPPEIRAVVEALQPLRGVAQLTAVTVVAEFGSLSRFANPRQLMGYSGLGSSEYSSGNRVQRVDITKTQQRESASRGDRIGLGLAAPSWIGGFVSRRQRDLQLTPEVKKIAWKAQWRLHNRYKKLAAAGKKKPQIITSVGRELLRFICAIAVQTETNFNPDRKAA